MHVLFCYFHSLKVARMQDTKSVTLTLFCRFGFECCQVCKFSSQAASQIGLPEWAEVRGVRGPAVVEHMWNLHIGIFVWCCDTYLRRQLKIWVKSWTLKFRFPSWLLHTQIINSAMRNLMGHVLKLNYFSLYATSRLRVTVEFCFYSTAAQLLYHILLHTFETSEFRRIHKQASPTHSNAVNWTWWDVKEFERSENDVVDTSLLRSDQNLVLYRLRAFAGSVSNQILTQVV